MAWGRWVRLGVIVTLIVVGYFVVPVSVEERGDTVVRSVVGVVILGLLGYAIVRQLRLHLDDNARRVDGLIAAIVLAVVVFAMAFYALEDRRPEQIVGLHTRLDSLYFTVATLTTVGFGDIHAVGQTARAIVLVQMVFNVVFIATAVALLSSRVSDAARNRAEERRTPEAEAP